MNVCSLSAILAVSTAAALAGGEPARDIDKLKGAWLVIGGEADGRALPEEEVKKKVIVRFAAETLVLTEDGKQDKVELKYKLDPTQKPKAIDITPETAERGVIRGIYQLDGDTLKVCLGEPGKERPAKFETKPGSGHKLMKLSRMKPEKPER
jgi:uncharacterized protein (TIGR03067 family)